MPGLSPDGHKMAFERELYDTIVWRLDLEGAFKVAVHRLRRRYRDLLLANVNSTLSDPKRCRRRNPLSAQRAFGVLRAAPDILNGLIGCSGDGFRP